MNDDCIFCKIAAGEIPCHKVFENENVLAFLDGGPIAKGHTLIIPKKHFENIFDVDGENLKEIAVVIKNTANQIKKNLGATGINIINNNGKDAHQSVLHLHFHVVPRYKNDGLETWPKSEYKDKIPGAEIAKKIRGS